MTSDRPHGLEYFKDLGRWLRAYPRGKDQTTKALWWAVFKDLWLDVAIITLIFQLVWQLLFKSLVVLFDRIFTGRTLRGSSTRSLRSSARVHSSGACRLCR